MEKRIEASSRVLGLISVAGIDCNTLRISTRPYWRTSQPQWSRLPKLMSCTTTVFLSLRGSSSSNRYDQKSGRKLSGNDAWCVWEWVWESIGLSLVILITYSIGNPRFAATPVPAMRTFLSRSRILRSHCSYRTRQSTKCYLCTHPAHCLDRPGAFAMIQMQLKEV